MSGATYLALLGLVGLLRLGELLVSRRRIARLPAGTPAADSGSMWGSMVALHTGLLLLPALEVLGRDASAPRGVALLALCFLSGAFTLRYACIVTLGPAWNARGLVPSDLEVVTRGPYRLCRHPNYLAVLIEFVALPAAGGAWISLVLLNAIHVPLLLRRIRGEEELLGRVPGYREALDGLPRLLPLGRRRPRES